MINQLEKLLPRHVFDVLNARVIKGITQGVPDEGMQAEHVSWQVQSNEYGRHDNEHSGSLVLIA